MSIYKLGLAVAMTLAAPVAAAQDDPCDPSGRDTEALSLEHALLKAAEVDLRPELAISAVRAARTERAIAALRPADTIGLQIEDFPGTGLASNIDSLQVTATFSRVWERGGKREAREAFADATVDVAETAFSSAKYDLRAEVETLFLEAALAERRVELACQRVAIAANLQETVQRRVDAARDPLLSGARASSERLQAEAEARRYSAQAENLRAVLGSYWMADTDFRIDSALFEVDASLVAMDLSQLYSPELERLEAERRRSSAQIRLEQAQAIPDVTWSVGARKFGIEDDLAVIGGVSIPLGSRVRSEAGTARARANQRSIELEMDVIRQQLLRQAVAYQRAALSAAEEIEEIDTILLPAANEAVKLAEDGYGRGALSYLDVVDAQRTVAELREERLEHLRTYLMNQSALGRLVQPDSRGTGLESQQ